MTRFGSYETPKMPTIPTFLQYLKTAHRKGIENKTRFPVEIIWLPGKFDNVTLQTHAFRYIATPDNALYKDVLEYANEIEGLDKQAPNNVPRLEIVITDFDKKVIDLVENTKVLIVWEAMGGNALKAK